MTFDQWKTTEPDYLEGEKDMTCPRCHGDGTQRTNAARPCLTCLGGGLVDDLYADAQIERHLLGEPQQTFAEWTKEAGGG